MNAHALATTTPRVPAANMYEVWVHENGGFCVVQNTLLFRLNHIGKPELCSTYGKTAAEWLTLGRYRPIAEVDMAECGEAVRVLEDAENRLRPLVARHGEEADDDHPIVQAYEALSEALLSVYEPLRVHRKAATLIALLEGERA